MNLIRGEYDRLQSLYIESWNDDIGESLAELDVLQLVLQYPVEVIPVVDWPQQRFQHFTHGKYVAAARFRPKSDH